MSVPRPKHRHHRATVPVHSYIDNRVLRYTSESEARIMIAENADGSEMLGEDGKPIEPVARRISLRKHSLEIKLLAPLRRDRQSPCTITAGVMENNAFVHPGVRLSANDSMRTFDAATGKIEAWPEIHDDKAPVIAAGIAYGVSYLYRLKG